MCVYGMTPRAYDQMGNLLMRKGGEHKYREDLSLTCILFTFLLQIANLNAQKWLEFLLHPSWEVDFQSLLARLH